MSNSNISSPPDVGFALLLGPTWSLVLDSTSATLGRAVYSDKNGLGSTKRRTNYHSSKFPISRSLSTHTKQNRSESHTQESTTSKEEGFKHSPLFWISQWAKQQAQNNIASSEALFDDHGQSSGHDTSLDGVKIGSNDIESDTHPTKDESSKTDEKIAAQDGTPSSASHSTSQQAKPSKTEESSSSSLMGVEQVDQEEEISESCDIDLGPDPTISRLHATIAYDKELCLWDITCHSSNGAVVNGRTVFPHDGPALLPSKSRVQIGSVIFFFLLPTITKVESAAKASQTENSHSASSGASDTIKKDQEASKMVSITASSSLEEYIMDELLFEATSKNSSTGASTGAARATKKRRRNDRSIVPLKLIDVMAGEDRKAKRRALSEHVSKRHNSMRHILFGTSSPSSSSSMIHASHEEEAAAAEEEAWRNFLGMEKPTSTTGGVLSGYEDRGMGGEKMYAHLKANFDPPMEEYRESDRTSKYSAQSLEGTSRAAKIAANAAVAVAASAAESAAIAATEGAKSTIGSRGPRSNKPSEGVDASGTVYERPKLTYGQLIHLALDSAPDKRMLFPEISDFIERTFPYFRTGAAGNWHNTVRQQLSHTTDFVRQERTGPGAKKAKGGYWALSHWYEGDRLLPKPK